jgi:hypothetical protein
MNNDVQKTADNRAEHGDKCARERQRQAEQ